MLEKCILSLCLLFVASTPSCGAVNPCQNADGQIWKGVFQRKCQEEDTSAKEAMTGPFCTFEAKLHGNSTWLALTDVSYGACTAIQKDLVSAHVGKKHWTSIANMTQLIVSTPRETTSGTDCDVGSLKLKVPPPFFPSRGGNMISHAIGSITNGSFSHEVPTLSMTATFTNPPPGPQPGPSSSCTSTWTLFAAPRALPVKAVAIQSRETGLCLDLPGGDTTNGNKLRLWSCLLDSENQMWNFLDGQLVYAGNTSSPKCVDLFGGNTTNGVQLEIWDCARTPQQQWGFDTTTGAIYLATQIQQESLKCMDLRNGGAVKPFGKFVQLWDCYYGAWNQQWILHRSNGTEKHPKHTDLAQLLV